MSATDEIRSGVECYSETRSPNDIDPFKNDVFCYVDGQFMTYYTDQRTAGGDAIIRLCEVEIFGMLKVLLQFNDLHNKNKGGGGSRASVSYIC